ncbi:DALR anticodon-binding domain-containing protein [Streptomyces sp. NBC_01754]|uniref:ArgS-related anticodon-binding protein NrtL n=1 Tax=Streptomyces sp. NBC_01754 TaxID=2975930 RepID=UPI002DDA44D3|nr:DALR anticodon-binding domain-containing protein [Streptomyces sp. NBC_01754]WSC94827.1 DALR anticodon-binding domain-containing protein [Streptomyces sp. NBC_01754]
MTPAELSRTVLHAVRRAVAEDALRAPVPAGVRVERTKPGGSGHYACAVALQLAGPAALPAREVARILRDRVAAAPGVGRVEITGPGFLNFTLGTTAGAALVREVGERGLRYGRADRPTGEIRRLRHRHEVRAAVVADAVSRLLRARGVPARTGCEEAPDPDWARLGVAADAEDLPAAASREIRPVPAGATAGELLARLGPDATRWGLLRPAGHDHAPLGDDLLVQAESNPLFRVRYAHARVRGLVRGADRLGFTPSYEQDVPGSAAGALCAVLADHPRVLDDAARRQAPDRLARHLETVAGAFFDLHDTAFPLPGGDEKPSAAHRSRLALAEAAGTVLAGGLDLLGISAPEHL